MAIVLIALMAVFFLGMGVYGLLAPTSLVKPFGIGLTGPNARTEVRAVYGGFGVAIAGVLVVAMLDPVLRPGVVLAVAVALLGMAFGRLIGLFIDRPAGFCPGWFYFCVEIAGGAVLLAARAL